MKFIDHHSLPHSTVLSVYADRDEIWMDPDYQRQGEVWPIEKKQLLIDSLINRYDVPKLYFHELDRATAQKTKKRYAVIDGKQRLEAIFGFISGEFPLSKEFEFLQDESDEAANSTYADLAKKFPKLKQRLDSFSLPITVVKTDDIDLIEDMFFRLNEATPLNAAEKRNAYGGDMSKAFATLTQNSFFTKKVRFSDNRYRHREVAARLIFIELCVSSGRLIDTKKPFLDKMTNDYKTGKKKLVSAVVDKVENILTEMTKVFSNKDILLAAQAAVPVYYLLFRESIIISGPGAITRVSLEKFNTQRQENRIKAEKNIVDADFELLEFDRMSQQGTNDAGSIRERLRIISKHLKIPVSSRF